jgi:hypothetical protein
MENVFLELSYSWGTMRFQFVCLSYIWISLIYKEISCVIEIKL